MSYLVGEQGPELFTPSSSGNISTAGETAGMMGGWTINGGIHIHANSEAEGQAGMRGALAAARARGY
jgi:phage-related minor tail protein